MATIPREFIEELKEANPILDVAAKYFDVVQVGAVYKAHCKHGRDSDMSLTFYPDTNTFHCFGCGAGTKDTTSSADVIAFVQWAEEIGYMDAIKILAQRVNKVIPQREDQEDLARRRLIASTARQIQDYHQALLAADPYMEYLAKRGIDRASVVRWSLGLQDTKIVYPVHGISGDVLSFSLRRNPFFENSDEVKYQNMSNSIIFKKGNVLYGLHKAMRMVREKNYVVIVEGYNDVICMQKYGEPAVSVMSNIITDNQIEVIKKYTNNAILFLDGDYYGIEGMHRSAKKMINAGMRVKVLLGPNKDPDDIANELQGKLKDWMYANATYYGQFCMNEIIGKFRSAMTTAKLSADFGFKQLMESAKFSDAERQIYEKQIQDVLLDKVKDDTIN